MIEFSQTIREGVHARPAALLAHLLKDFRSDVMLSCRGKHVNGKEPLAVMSLSAAPGDRVSFAAEGPDERETAEAAQRFFLEHL